MKIINVLVGPKLGDLLHSLAFCRYVHDYKNMKCNIYITETNDKFQLGLEKTYQDLLPIMKLQNFCNSFEIHTEQPIQINLMKFRNSPYLYKTTWSQVILNTFISSQPKIPHNFKIIDLPGNERYSNALIINRANGKHDISDFTKKIYQDILDQFDEKYFIFTEDKHYEEFFYKKQVTPLYAPELIDFMQIIKGCKLFLGNQSGPLAMATVMDVPRVGELFHKTLFRDDVHYLNDIENFDNVELFNMDEIISNKNIYLKL
jgi:ADP-heptose:LPS heptosyltransferase